MVKIINEPLNNNISINNISINEVDNNIINIDTDITPIKAKMLLSNIGVNLIVKKYNSRIIDKNLEATIIDVANVFNLDYFESQFDLELNLKTKNIGGNLKQNKLNADIKYEDISAKIKNSLIGSEIIDKLVIYYDDNSNMNSVIFNFTASDLVNNKLTKTHNLNKTLVDVSVFDNTDTEVMVGLNIINNNSVELDFSRVTVTGTWKLMIEG